MQKGSLCCLGLLCLLVLPTMAQKRPLVLTFKELRKWQQAGLKPHAILQRLYQASRIIIRPEEIQHLGWRDPAILKALRSRILPEGWLLYYNQQTGLQIQQPVNWKMTYQPDREGAQNFELQPSGEANETCFFLSFATLPQVDELTTTQLKMITQTMLRNIGHNMPGLHFRSTPPAQPHFRGLCYAVSSTNQNIPVKGAVYTFFKQPRIFFIMFTAPVSCYQHYQPLFLRIMNSISFALPEIPTGEQSQNSSTPQQSASNKQ